MEVFVIQYNTIQYNTIQYNTIQYNTIQYNTIQCNTIRYDTIQYNTIQHNNIDHSEFITDQLQNILSKAIKNEIKCFDFGSIKRELRLRLRIIKAI